MVHSIRLFLERSLHCTSFCVKLACIHSLAWKYLALKNQLYNTVCRSPGPNFETATVFSACVPRVAETRAVIYPE